MTQRGNIKIPENPASGGELLGLKAKLGVEGCCECKILTRQFAGAVPGSEQNPGDLGNNGLRFCVRKS